MGSGDSRSGGATEGGRDLDQSGDRRQDTASSFGACGESVRSYIETACLVMLPEQTVVRSTHADSDDW